MDLGNCSGCRKFTMEEKGAETKLLRGFKSLKSRVKLSRNGKSIHNKSSSILFNTFKKITFLKQALTIIHVEC